MKSFYRILLSLVLFALIGSVPEAGAQGFTKRLKDRAKQHAGERVIQKVIEKEDQAIDKVFEEGEEAVAGQEAADSNAAEPSGEPLSEGATVAEAKPGEGAWANYDFIPGERPLFVEDFSSDRIGNFPRRLEFVEGNMEVVEWNGGLFLRATTFPASFDIVLPEALPERFTLEFDIAPMATGWNSHVYFSDPGERPTSLVCGVYRAGLYEGSQGGGHSIMSLDGTLKNQVYTCRLTADGEYVKTYQNEHRVANVPNAKVGRSDRIYFRLAAAEEEPVLISNIRVMAGGSALYDALVTEGRVATQGILFDTGKADLRPESTPTLEEIGQMLQEHPELRLLVEGHTDNTGTPEGNQALSQARAEAVKAFIVAEYGIGAGRLEAKGFGGENPVADNTTPEGRQQNRRVELVKL